MLVEHAERIRDQITLFYASSDASRADEMLHEYGEQLPRAIRLECEGNAYFYRRMFDDAASCYEEAISLAPGRIIARYQYLAGIQQEQQGNFEEALRRYGAAIDAEGTFVDAYVELGGLLAKLRHLQGAARCYRDAIHLEPDNIDICFNLMTVLGELAKGGGGAHQDEYDSVASRYNQLLASGTRHASPHYRW